MDALRDETRDVGEIFTEKNCGRITRSRACCERVPQVDVFQNDILNGEGVDARKRAVEVDSDDHALVRCSIAKNVAHSCVRNRKEGFIAQFSSDRFQESNDSNDICFWRRIENISS